ncbi:MAG TPA: DUF4352 domain-containing protein [Acidimicrobiales bacterium]|nr:DUF4352 domain-containing protein [Acidimicrobiales bacterium]
MTQTADTTTSTAFKPTRDFAPLTTASSAAPSTTTAKAAIGDAITLRSNREGVRMEVTVLRALDPAPAPKVFGEAGAHYVAIQLRLKNVGAAPYDDSPGNGSTLIDSASQQYTPSLGDTTAGPGFSGGATIVPGDLRVGFLTFVVAAGASPAKFQFALDSGFGPETGQWVLTG